MNMDLNLLPSQAKFQAKKNQLLSIVKKISYGFGSLWLLSLIIIFVWWKVVAVDLERSEKDYGVLLFDYESVSEGAVLSERLKYQAKLVGKVLKDRFEYGESIKRVTSLFSDQVKLDDVNLTSHSLYDLGGTVEGVEGSDEIEEKVAMINSGNVEGLESAEIKSLVWKHNFWMFDMEVTSK